MKRALALHEEPPEDTIRASRRLLERYPNLRSGDIVHTTEKIILPALTEREPYVDVWCNVRNERRRYYTNAVLGEGKLMLRSNGYVDIELMHYMHRKPRYDWEMSRKRYRLAGTPVVVFNVDPKIIRPGFLPNPRSIQL